jgi:hypothetical protein
MAPGRPRWEGTVTLATYLGDLPPPPLQKPGALTQRLQAIYRDASTSVCVGPGLTIPRLRRDYDGPSERIRIASFSLIRKLTADEDETETG